MTCMEIPDRGSTIFGGVYYVFNDGELAQIVQAQAIPYNRNPARSFGTKHRVRGAGDGAAFCR